jgi:hypothetical protein
VEVRWCGEWGWGGGVVDDLRISFKTDIPVCLGKKKNNALPSQNSDKKTSCIEKRDVNP